MPIPGLTERQSTFVETYILVPRYGLGKKKAKKRRNEATRDFGRFNVNHDAVQARLDAIEDPTQKKLLENQLAQAEKLIGTDPKKLDFDAASEQLAAVNKAISDALAQKEAREKHAIATARMDAVEEGIPLDNKDDIDILWAFADGKFQSGIKGNHQNDLDASVKAMDQLFALIIAGREDITGEGKEARRDLRDVEIALQELQETANTAFGIAHVPPTVTTLFEAVTAALVTGGNADVAGLPAAAVDASTKLVAARAGSQKMISDRAAWDKEHDRFRKRYDVMEAHPLASEATYVLPKFKTVTDAYKAAADEALAHRYAKAVTDLTPVFVSLKDALAFADDYAVFQEVLEKRRVQLGTLPAQAQCTFDEVKNAIGAATQLMTDAEAARDAQTMDVALQKLTDLVAAVQNAQGLSDFEDTYLGQRNRYKAKYNKRNSESATVKALIQTDLDFYKRQLDEAKAKATGGEIGRAAEMLNDLGTLDAIVKKRIAVVTEFLAAEAAFKLRYEEVDALTDDEGLIAIKAYQAQLVEDKARIIKWKAKGEFGLALTSATALKSIHSARMHTAALGKAYVALKTPLDAEIARLEGGANGAAQAAGAIAITKQLMAEALTKTQSDDWYQAVKLLNSATANLATGTFMAENAHILDGMQDTTKLDGIDTDFDAAYAEFTKVHDAVKGIDSDNDFQDLLRAAKATADQASTAANQEPPDFVQARARLETATADCKSVLMKIYARERYVADAETLKTNLKDLEKRNKKKCVQLEVDAIKAHLESAKQAVKSPAFNFDTALVDISEGDRLFWLGDDAADEYEGYKDALESLAKGLKVIKNPKVAAALDREIQRLEDIIDAIEAAFVARDFPTLRAKISEGRSLRRPYEELARLYLIVDKRYQKRVKDRLGDEMTNPGAAGLATEINALIAAIDDNNTKHNYVTSLRLISDCDYLITRAKTAAAEHGAWQPVKTAAQDALTDLQDRDDVANGPAHSRIAELETIFDSAIDKEALGNFSGATKRLTGFPEMCRAATPLVDIYDMFIAARDTAVREIGRIQKKGTVAIAPLFTRIEGKRDNALRMGVAFEFDTAIALFNELLADCVTADNAFEAQAEFDGVLEQIKDINDDDVDDLKLSITAARATFKKLAARPSAIFVQGPLTAIADKIDLSETLVDTDFATALTRLREAVDSCSVLAGEMGRFDQFSDSAELARKLATDLQKGHPQGEAAKVQIDGLVAQVIDCVAQVRGDPTKRSAMRDALETVITDCRALEKLLDKRQIWHLEARQIEAELSILEKSEHRSLIRPEITEIRAKLDSSATKCDAPDHAGAMKDLAGARDRITMAHLRTKVTANQAPTADELKTLLAAPDGAKLLDEIINGLDQTAQRKVMNAAFEARFGCKLDLFSTEAKLGKGRRDKDLGKKAPNIKRFYEIMSKIPPSETLDNDSMLIFSTVTEDVDDTSSYNESRKEVAMREGDSGDSSIYAVGLEHELGVDPATLNLDVGEPMSFFSWNTLHEVGHAVDDKLGFMNRNGQALAGWEVYGANIAPVATAIAADFEYDADYVAEYISYGEGRNPPIPARPASCASDEEWDRRRREVRIFVDRCREDAEPWQTDSAAKKATTSSGRIYHESYGNDWSSYLYSARSDGVSGYQFRAPGEWFSELYAAYHSKKLKPAHTHYTQIDTL